jgi:hypothetical protein
MLGLKMDAPPSVTVSTTENRGHSAEELAEMALAKIIQVGEDLPEPIKAQAEAYRDRLRHVLVFYMRQAMLSQRVTIVAAIQKAEPDLDGLLDFIRSI